ncbi:DUF2887 domain-containing protein [Synechococcus elongatus]|uniref:Uncharacterized protein n=1 Tax=Synechococcus elongatus (strain ATCC 33912 / PCC 7942 / FACHB-805) TaxID=1140 RepID=Q31S73_SYNE7|nr:DUF2887 domain-containing protein [Synechococcus elongatus]ABB56096.1 hypothetical protein Synpcc7942_0064 [Synechococcus elongatus PCC 7942 = FACHB-805]WKW05645.1 DUF2887 domain-containing protein [Synechococcus elongatus PCC 7942 = FACHB-805]
MKTDKLFYAIFATLPDLVTELVDGIPPAARYRFAALIVKLVGQAPPPQHSSPLTG